MNVLHEIVCRRQGCFGEANVNALLEVASERRHCRESYDEADLDALLEMASEGRRRRG